jgi:hypothetical protein
MRSGHCTERKEILMARIHFFEIADQPWLPTFLRDIATGFLLVSHNVAKLNELFVPKLRDALARGKQVHIIDLGSGAGGPLPSIVKDLRALGTPVTVTLSDFHPNQQSIQSFQSDPYITYEPKPIDATDVPVNHKGLRTMIGAFHHLERDSAKNMLLNAQTDRQSVAVFEAFGRNLQSFLALLPSVVMAFFLIPLIRPFRIVNLIFTYLLPVVPLLVFFDGWISFLRIYSPEELHEMIDELPKGTGYTWEIGTLGIQKAPYIIGMPE